jgi:hypothetical protein
MTYIYKVFEHLHLLWMGIIWLHHHTITSSPDLAELAESICDVVVQTIPLRYS